MIPDADLPVWTIRPNWRTPILERLEWLSDVLISRTGAEQRRAVRLSPRRSFEMLFNPFNGKRTFLDLLLHNVGSSEFMLPLFHDKAKLASGVVFGDDRLLFDTRWREFRVGDRLIVLGPDAYTFETVEIAAVDNNGVDLADELVYSWPKGTTVHPLRRARIADESNLGALTGSTGQATILFTLQLSNDYDPGADPAPTFEGKPIVVFPPNRVSSIDVGYSRIADTFDSQTGRAFTVDSAGRAFTSQQYNWMAEGREAQSELRKVFYRLQGKTKGVWMPSFNDDIILTESLDVTDTVVDFQRIGYTYAGGVKEGRDHLLFRGPAGEVQVAKINTTGAAPSPDEERVNLLTGVLYPQPVGRGLSFVTPARMDQDSIEITHHTDTDGACEANTVFRSYHDARVNPTPIYFPIPIAAMGTESCGEPEVGTECMPFFTGWFLKISMIPSIDTGVGAHVWCYHTLFQPHPTKGRYVNGFFEGPPIMYENGTPTEPYLGQNNLRGQLLRRQVSTTGRYDFYFYYQFPLSVFGDDITFNLHSQYPWAGGWPPPTFGGVMRAKFQIWDRPEVDYGIIGGAGDLWPQDYVMTIENIPSLSGA